MWRWVSDDLLFIDPSWEIKKKVSSNEERKLNIIKNNYAIISHNSWMNLLSKMIVPQGNLLRPKCFLLLRWKRRVESEKQTRHEFCALIWFFISPTITSLNTKNELASFPVSLTINFNYAHLFSLSTIFRVMKTELLRQCANYITHFGFEKVKTDISLKDF